MFRKLIQHTRKPEGFLGRLMLRGMNQGHAALSAWGLAHLGQLAPDARVLDVGCGGGANLKRFLLLCPQGQVDGIDYSKESVAYSRRLNQRAQGRCQVRQGDAMALPYEDASFDQVSAFETVYFWPDLFRGFQEVFRVLRPGGRFLIVCEGSGMESARWEQMIAGMTVHSAEDLQKALRTAGFPGITLHRGKKGRICLVAMKTA